MARRGYRQYCGLAKALDVVGERWTMLVVRELLPGPKRYSDLIQNLPGIGTSLLADRLRRLEREGLVARSYLPPPAASTVYELTEDGRDLAAALMPLVAWGARRLGRPRRGEAVRLRWVMDFLAATCDEERAAGVFETYEFRLPQGAFHVRVEDGSLTFTEGEAPAAPDVVVETTLETLAGLESGAVELTDEVAAGRLKVTGSRGARANALAILRPSAGTRVVARRPRAQASG